MSETLCPCCGNPPRCDCHTAQSTQFRRIAEAENVMERQVNILARLQRDIDQAAIEYREDAVAILTKWIDRCTEKDRRIAELEAELAKERGEGRLLRDDIDALMSALADTRAQLAEERARLAGASPGSGA